MSVAMPEVIVVTGMSGAGKTIVLRTLEDAGFFCIDNLPTALVHLFFNPVSPVNLPAQKIALGIDIRGGMTETMITQLADARAQSGYSMKIIFVTATRATLIKRFQETRRQHPLGNSIDLSDALAQEKDILLPLELLADHIIDTDQLNLHQLRALVRALILPDGLMPMAVTLTSFGFKYGVPAEHNFVFDVRSLPNPYFIPELRALSGLDDAIVKYLFEQEDVRYHEAKLIDFFLFSLENARKEGRFVLQVAIGCTGGRHRSVALVERLAQLPREQVQFFIKHRDIDRDTDKIK